MNSVRFPRKLLPTQHWGPKPWTRRFGSLFTSYRSDRVFVGFVAQAAQPLLAVGLTLWDFGSDPGSTGCVIQLSSLGVLAIVYSVFLMIASPFRVPGKGLLAIAAYELTGIGLISAALVQSAAGYILFAASVIGMLATVGSVGFAVYEKRCMRSGKAGRASLQGEHGGNNGGVGDASQAMLEMPALVNVAPLKNELSATAFESSGEVAMGSATPATGTAKQTVSNPLNQRTAVVGS